MRLEVSDELGLGGQNEEEGGTFGPYPGCSADPVDVVGVGGGRVILQDPVDLKHNRNVIVVVMGLLLLLRLLWLCYVLLMLYVVCNCFCNCHPENKTEF